MKPIKTKIDFGINVNGDNKSYDIEDTLKEDYTWYSMSHAMISPPPSESSPSVNIETQIFNMDFEKPPTIHGIDIKCLFGNLKNKIQIQIPECVLPFIQMVTLNELEEYYLMTKHRDESRKCALYYALYPTDNYEPIQFEGGYKIGAGDGVWLVDLQEIHWFEMNGNTKRYNMQVTLNRPAEEMKALLEANNLV